MPKKKPTTPTALLPSVELLFHRYNGGEYRSYLQFFDERGHSYTLEGSTYTKRADVLRWCRVIVKRLKLKPVPGRSDLWRRVDPVTLKYLRWSRVP